MIKRRQKRHSEYYKIRGFQIINRYDDKYMASYLGCAPRTYRDKVSGWSDFSPLEGRTLSNLFKVSQEELFFTADVSRATL